MKLFRGLIVLALVAWAGVTSATEAYTCNGCSYNQAQNIAWQRPVGAKSYVADYTNVQLYLFTKRLDRETRQYRVEQLLVPDADMQVFLDVAEYRIMYPASASFEREVTDYGDVTRNAYSILANTSHMDYVRTGVATYFHSRGDDRVNRFMEIMSGVAYSTWAKVGLDIQLIVVVKFIDGTTAKFLVNKDNITQAQYIQGTARDANGNIIIDGSHLQNNGNGVVGLEFYFDGEFGSTVEDWIEQLRQMGVPYTGPTSGERVVTECTVTPEGMRCTGRLV